MRVTLLTWPSVLAAIVGLAGCGMPSFLVTPVPNVNRLVEYEVAPGRGWGAGKIVIIEVEGMLLNAQAGGLLQPSENKVSLFAQQLEQAAADDRVKAVVLRVNSPGGTVTASDTMYQILQRFRHSTGKPVIASLQDVAASGAYYVACGSDAIVATPTSIVGSIGVIYNTFDFGGTLSRIGARTEAIKSGPLKDMGSVFDPLSPEERQVMQGLVDEYFHRFVSVVTSHREFKTPADLQRATDGRVFSGSQGLEIGLVDQLGLLEDAIDLARHVGNAPKAGVVMYKRPYGYRGSIYADSYGPTPQANVLYLSLPQPDAVLPSGFYYMWRP
jgi:protease-4